MKILINQDNSIDIFYKNWIVRINYKLNTVSICDIDIPIKGKYYDEICENAINYFIKEILNDNVA